MVQASFNFPTGFVWGTATSSYQVEGQNKKNNWYAWEQEGHIINNHTCGAACDWWGGRWREDFDRASESGQNAHRMSIEWSRIQPTPDRWDEDALDYYRSMVRSLNERDLTPMVTLHHFTDPLWLSDMGGWENEDVSGLFESYVRKVVDALSEYVTLWCTINEPNVYAVNGYVRGDFPPGKKHLRSAFRVMENLVKGHAAAYHAIHELQPHARVGIANYYRGMKPAHNWSPLDRGLAAFQSRLFNNFFPLAASDGILRFPFVRKGIPEARGTQDFLGIDYYTQEFIAFNLMKSDDFFSRRFYDPEAEMSDTGLIANQPQGLFEALNWGRKFNLPIIVTENGVEDADDHLRPRYLIEHLHQVWRGVNFNWPIKGYFHWSLVDNFEWERGWTQRFGLWELNTESQARVKRPSADLYAAICQENAISSEMVAEYAPKIIDKLFPG
ncbi:MAG: family 1 glycosylhydrolase [Anaerolineales bacterium]|jgi:beta-glucosidase